MIKKKYFMQSKVVMCHDFLNHNQSRKNKCTDKVNHQRTNSTLFKWPDTHAGVKPRSISG